MKNLLNLILLGHTVSAQQRTRLPCQHGMLPFEIWIFLQHNILLYWRLEEKNVESEVFYTENQA